MAKFSPPKGMRDFYPEDYRSQLALFDAWREAAARFGFEAFDAPVVETMELLERKAGEEISEQIYTFEDKSGNRLALRPELTPSLARMIIARQGGLTFPLKWSAIAQCFRYERMQRGRKREHYQLNMDIVGEDSISAEVEVIGAAITALKTLELDASQVAVRVGSRRLLMELFAAAGIEERHFMACCLALDKRGKIPDEAIAELLTAEGVNAENVERIFSLIALDSLDAVRHQLGESEALTQLDDFFTLADEAGLIDWLKFDLGVIRGLGYYTGIVFEAFDRGGKFRAIFGGGRYDSLLSSLGGQTMPCVGLGFGDVVVMELLADLGLTPGAERQIPYCVGYMETEGRSLATAIARRLRERNEACDLVMRAMKPRKFFDRANKIGAQNAIFIGGDEVASGEFEIKNMQDGPSRRERLETLYASNNSCAHKEPNDGKE